jgi:ABC-type glycerol-3-phosphate transport system permease component
MTVQLNNIVNSVQGVKEYNVNMAATLLTGLVPLVDLLRLRQSCSCAASPPAP